MGLNSNKKKEKGVVFDEKMHKYYYNGNELTSVTTWINDRFVPEFQAIFAANNKAKSNQKNGCGITNPVELRKYWRLKGERASSLGTSVHKFAEMYYMDSTTAAVNGYEEAVISVMNAMQNAGWKIVDMERTVYSLEYLLGGMLDVVMEHEEKGIGILDWKTTEDMHKSYNKMKKEMKGIEASALNKYALQLGTYNVVGEIGAPHTNLFIVQLHKDGTYTVYSGAGSNKIPDYSDKIAEALYNRRIEETHPLLTM